MEGAERIDGLRRGETCQPECLHEGQGTENADVECADNGWFETTEEVRLCHGVMDGSYCRKLSRVELCRMPPGRSFYLLTGAHENTRQEAQDKTGQHWQGWTMSTFKRKSSSITAGTQAGTRASPFSSSTVVTSSGIASLDDILGGGLPLSSSLLVIAPDTHSSYGELVQKYFISQGLASGQKVCVVDGEPGQFVSECMWHSNGTSPPSVIIGKDDEGDGNETDHEAKVEIAWRYEHLKPVWTSASGSKLYVY